MSWIMLRSEFVGLRVRVLVRGFEKEKIRLKTILVEDIALWT